MSIKPFIPHPSLAGSDPVDALRLIRSENVGPVTFFHLVKFCGSVGRALEMAPDIARRGGSKRPIRIASKAEAQREFEALTKHGAKLVLYGESAYPRLLLYANDAPPLLCVKGHTHLQEGKLIAIVGARNASLNAINFTRKLARDLGESGFTIASGLARGIDASAHTASLATGTVAVIAGGIDTVYPPENANLYADIIASGVLVSEMPFGAQPLARSFPARNRIIAGMAQGLVVVEASLKSGSLITAQYAADYHRDVFAVPGSPLDPRAQGPNKLIREGAMLLESAQDIIAHYRSASWGPLQEASREGFAAPADLPPEAEIDAARAVILEKLSASPSLVDELIAECDKPASIVLAALLELELAGKIERHIGGRVSLNIGEDACHIA